MNTAVDIEATGVAKAFGSTVALADFSLHVPRGEFLTLLGPSGCGKTTALRLVAGFERPDAGSITIGGAVVADDVTMVAPQKRRVGLVFQDYALFPHLSVGRNVAYGLSGRDRGRVGDVLALVGLEGLEDRMPHELSGGQQQRVALARALAPEPSVILLDEPFSNLDAELRQRVRRELRAILRTAGTTVVFVTHDQEEALSMSDTVAVMHDGTVVQVGPPDEVYRRPATAWVAGFMGDANFVSGTADGVRVTTPLGEFPTTTTGAATVMIRPENVALTPDPTGRFRVTDREYFGHDELVSLSDVDGFRIRARLDANRSVSVSVADTVHVSVLDTTVFPALSAGDAP